MRPDSHNVATRPATARHAVAGRGSMSVRHQTTRKEKRKVLAGHYATTGVFLENADRRISSGEPKHHILI